MITVFDVATEEELKRMFGEVYDKKFLLKYITPAGHYARLALLYCGRKDIEKSEEYLNLITDTSYRRQILNFMHELSD